MVVDGGARPCLPIRAWPPGETMTEDELAWALAEVAGPCLNGPQRHQLYIAIGTSEFLAAIMLALDAVVRHDVALSPEIVPRLNAWLDRYPGHEDEPTLRRLITSAKSLPHGQPSHPPPSTPAYLELTHRYRRRRAR